MARCHLYLHERSPDAAKRAKATIRQYLAKLKTAPGIGRPYAEDPTLRELVIPFGQGAYLALYRYEPERDIVRILAFKHGREEKYRP